MFLVQHLLEESAKRLPNKTALVCGEKRLSYSEIDAQANLLAAALIEMGVKRQDRVVIFMDNSVESVVAMFGILKAGAIFIILNATMKARKLNYVMKDSGAVVLITKKSMTPIVKESIDGPLDLKHIIWKGQSGSKSMQKVDKIVKSRPISHDWNTLIATTGQQKNLPPISDLSQYSSPVDLDLATIIYTSGSTGNPKGVMCAHYNVLCAARSISSYLENTQEDIILSALPLSFDYGLYQIIMTFLFGGTVVLEKSFTYPFQIMERLVLEGATGFPIVPTMAAILLQMDGISELELGRLRYLTNTAAALPVAHIRRLQRLFSSAKIFSMYGLTECKRVSYLPPKQLEHRPDSVGIPIPNEEVWIVDSEGNKLGPHETGELVVRGSNVMQGYWNDPEETARRFKNDPCCRELLLYTGDIFRMDQDGYLYFISRKDDLLKTKGERVSPKEIEACLHNLKGVSEAAVIGVPDDILGQAIKAFIVTDNKVKITKTVVMKYCQKNLEPFMVPKFIEFRDSLPKSPNGKIDKKNLS